MGNLEPAYIYNNSVGSAAVNITDYGYDGGISPDSSAGYIQAGRDYYTGIAKPGYTEYAYPHPLRVALMIPPSNAVITITVQ